MGNETCEELERRLEAKGGISTRLLIMEGADHKDTVLALGDPGSPLAAAVLEMIESAR